jgi:baculoviral IAP repeat-containing protein 6
VGSLLLPWQRLLVMPPQHMLVIERMHSGARRFVVLDFGNPVLLTDLMIPACSDLVSLSIDIWCQGEETDGQRLIVASDIGTKSLVISDLQPPPVCRYLKVYCSFRFGWQWKCRFSSTGFVMLCSTIGS